jgi:hypothetical protein
VPGFARVVLGTLLARLGRQMWEIVLVLFVLQRYRSPSLAGLTVLVHEPQLCRGADRISARRPVAGAFDRAAATAWSRDQRRCGGRRGEAHPEGRRSTGTEPDVPRYT